MAIHHFQIAFLHFTTVVLLICIALRNAHSQQVGEIRLLNGGDSSRGRVELYDGRHWGTVCDDDWDDADARVVCQQLGHVPDGAEATYAAYFGQGTGMIHLDNVECVGTESRLLFCTNSREPNCDHSEDAGVICAPRDGDVRLADGNVRSEGRVEVFYNGRWSTVCDRSWDDTDARVVCRQVGFSEGYSQALSNAYFGPGSGTTILDDVRCDGSEAGITSCRSSGIYSITYCSHSDDASVKCDVPEPIPESFPNNMLVILCCMALFLFVLIFFGVILRKYGVCENVTVFQTILRRKPVSNPAMSNQPDTPPELSEHDASVMDPRHAEYVDALHAQGIFPLQVDINEIAAYMQCDPSFHNNTPPPPYDSAGEDVAPSVVDGPSAEYLNDQPPLYERSVSVIDQPVSPPPVAHHLSHRLSIMSHMSSTGQNNPSPPPPYAPSETGDTCSVLNSPISPGNPTSPTSIAEEPSTCLDSTSAEVEPPPYSPWRESTFV